MYIYSIWLSRLELNIDSSHCLLYLTNGKWSTEQKAQIYLNKRPNFDCHWSSNLKQFKESFISILFSPSLKKKQSSFDWVIIYSDCDSKAVIITRRKFSGNPTDWRTNAQIGKQEDRNTFKSLTQRQTDRQTDRQRDRQTDRQTNGQHSRNNCNINKNFF